MLLGNHAALDAIEHLLDNTGASFAGEVRERGIAIECLLGLSQPAVRLLSGSENLLGESSDAREPKRLVRLLDREKLVLSLAA